MTWKIIHQLVEHQADTTQAETIYAVTFQHSLESVLASLPHNYTQTYTHSHRHTSSPMYLALTPLLPCDTQILFIGSYKGVKQALLALENPPHILPKIAGAPIT